MFFRSVANHVQDQDGARFFFLRPKNGFLVEPKGQETVSGIIFEN
jgi:hypothetical protein